MTGRRLERVAASDAYRTYDAPALGLLDEVVLGDTAWRPAGAGNSSRRRTETSLTELPWTRVAFGLGGGGVWHDCLRELQVGDVVRLRCAGSRAVEFLTLSLARAEASEGDALAPTGSDRLCGAVVDGHHLRVGLQAPTAAVARPLEAALRVHRLD